MCWGLDNESVGDDTGRREHVQMLGKAHQCMLAGIGTKGWLAKMGQLVSRLQKIFNLRSDSRRRALRRTVVPPVTFWFLPLSRASIVSAAATRPPPPPPKAPARKVSRLSLGTSIDKIVLASGISKIDTVSRIPPPLSPIGDFFWGWGWAGHSCWVQRHGVVAWFIISSDTLYCTTTTNPSSKLSTQSHRPALQEKPFCGVGQPNNIRQPMCMLTPRMT